MHGRRVMKPVNWGIDTCSLYRGRPSLFARPVTETAYVLCLLFRPLQQTFDGRHFKQTTNKQATNFEFSHLLIRGLIKGLSPN